MQLAPDCIINFGPLMNITCDGCGGRLPRDAMLATTPAGDDFCEPCATAKGLWENPEHARVVPFGVRMAEYMKLRDESGESRRDAERIVAALERFEWPELPPQPRRCSAADQDPRE